MKAEQQINKNGKKKDKKTITGATHTLRDTEKYSQVVTRL